MLKLKFHNHHNQEDKIIPLDEQGVDFLDKNYQFRSFMSEHPDTLEGLKAFVEYYSNHYQDISIITDHDDELGKSEDLNKAKTFKTGVSSVSPSIGLERLKQIKQDNYVGAGGKDYDLNELHQRMFEIGEKQAQKMPLFQEQESSKTHGSFEEMAPPPMPKRFQKFDIVPPMIEKDEKNPYGKVFISGKQYAQSKQGQQTKATLFPKPRTAPTGQLPSYGKVIQPKPFGKDELASLLTKGSARLEKMSRPRITFPKFPKVTTRPDQEVQVIETPRQKELFGRKSAQALTPDTSTRYVPSYRDQEGKITFGPEETRKIDYQQRRDEQSKLIAGQLGRSAYGKNVPGKGYSVSGAIAGKLRSKFESPDEGQVDKLKEHREKTNEVISRNNQKVKDWNAKYYELKAQAGTSPEHRDAFFQHVNSKPVLERKPRKPPVKAKETKSLSPEAMKMRGQTTAGTVEHEGLHNVFDDLERKYGKPAADKAKAKILESFDKDTLSHLKSFVQNVGYKTSHPGFSEEMLTHARDILVNPKKRESFKAHIGEEKYKDVMGKLKQGWQKAYQTSQSIRPEDVGVSQENPNVLGAAAERIKN